MPFGLMQHLDISVVADADEATSRGFVYGTREFTAVEIEKVVVVRNGMQSGKPSVDLILKDETGKRYVVMITGALLKSIPCGV